MSTPRFGGYGGYKASFAGGNSGISFGGNQMGMGNHTEHVAIFASILKNAKNTAGEKIFKKSEVELIVGKDNSKLQVKGQTVEQVFGKNLARVNEALASPYGMKVINEVYLVEIAAVINKIDSIVKDIKNPAAKEFYSTDFGRALLCDYSNAFGLKRDGKFIVEYIDGFYNGLTRNVYPSKTDKIEAPRDVYTIADHQNYLHSTKEWYLKSKQVDGRLNKSLDILKQYGLTPNGYKDLSEAIAKKGHLLKVSEAFGDLFFDYADYYEEDSKGLLDYDDNLLVSNTTKNFALVWNNTDETWDAYDTIKENIWGGYDFFNSMSDEMMGLLPENGIFYDSMNNHLFCTMRFQHPAEEGFMDDWHHINILKICPYQIDNFGYLDCVGLFLQKTPPSSKFVNDLYQLYDQSTFQDTDIVHDLFNDMESVTNTVIENDLNYLNPFVVNHPLENFFLTTVES